MALAGLDIGTSGCKFTILDEQSNVLGKDYCPYEQNGRAVITNWIVKRSGIPLNV